jgi:hypothetical protein
VETETQFLLPFYCFPLSKICQCPYFILTDIVYHGTWMIKGNAKSASFFLPMHVPLTLMAWSPLTSQNALLNVIQIKPGYHDPEIDVIHNYP